VLYQISSFLCAMPPGRLRMVGNVGILHAERYVRRSFGSQGISRWQVKGQIIMKTV